MESPEALIHFELKYCERCGGLWLRPCDSAAVYCSPCARQMAEIARRFLHRQFTGVGSAIAVVTACLIGAQPWLGMATGCSV